MNSKDNLVLYFSVTGNTKLVAKKISDVLESDIVEIIPQQRYSSADLDYRTSCRANNEQKDTNSRPIIENKIEIDYNTIYIGYPIWWGTCPKIILSLLDNYNFDNKNIILFCTSGGSGISQSISDLKNYNSKMNIIDGKEFNCNVTKSEIMAWLNK